MFETIAIAIAVSLVSMAIQMALAPKPPKPTAGKLDVATAEEGSSIGWTFGTNLMKSVNVTFYGNAQAVPMPPKGGKK